MLQLKFHLWLLPTPHPPPHRWKDHKSLFTSPLRYLWNLSAPLSPPNIRQIWVPIMSHLDYLTGFLTSLQANPFPLFSPFHTQRSLQLQMRSYHTFAENQCIPVTTKTTQSKLEGYENLGHILPFQVHSLAGLPKPQSYRTSVLTQTLLVLPWAPRMLFLLPGALLPDTLQHFILSFLSTSEFSSYGSERQMVVAFFYVIKG